MQPLEDCLTFAPIRPEYHIRTRSGDFDIETLYRYYTDNNLDQPRDPFDRQPLSLEDSDRVLDYSRRQTVQVVIFYLSHSGSTLSTNMKVKRHTNMGSVVCKILTDLEYIRAPKLSVLSNKIEYDYIIDIPGESCDSVYRMDFESPLPLPEYVQVVEVSMLRVHNSRLNLVIKKLQEYCSTRIYDPDANYMAIDHYCSNYKPRPEPLHTAPVSGGKRILYDDSLDKYFDQDGREIPELND